MKGILTKSESGEFVVKWSDTHSFSHGTMWCYTELSSDSKSIKYLKDNKVIHKPLEEGLQVEFEHVILYFDSKTFSPSMVAKLVFPEVENFEKEQLIKQYVLNGGELFLIDEVHVLRDGGTIAISPRNEKQHPFYIHKDNFTLHDNYPTQDDNIVTDEPTKRYVLDRLIQHKEYCESNLKRLNNIIDKIKI